MTVEKAKRKEDSEGKKYSEEEVEELIEKKLAESQKKSEQGKTEGNDPDMKETMQQLAQLIAQNNEEKSKKDLELKGDREYVSIEDIDPDDRMEIPEVFFTHQYGYLIVDDKRNGQAVSTPFGNNIRFKQMASKKRQKGRDEYHLHIATYATYSKKEAEWLRNHTLFGVKFFSRLDQATQQHAQKSEIFAKHYTRYSGLGASQLINQCKQNGLSPADTNQKMILALAENSAEKDLKGQEERSRKILEENQEDQEILDGKR